MSNTGDPTDVVDIDGPKQKYPNKSYTPPPQKYPVNQYKQKRRASLDINQLDPSIKEQRRRTVKYFANNNDELINFLKTKREKEKPIVKLNKLLIDDATRQQFEELAREYVGSIAEEKKLIQNEYYQLSQKYLKLQESSKMNHENIENLENKLNNSLKLNFDLENCINQLNLEKQEFQTNISKLNLNLSHFNDTILNLNNDIDEYKQENIILKNNLNQLNINIINKNGKKEELHNVINVENIKKNVENINKIKYKNENLKIKKEYISEINLLKKENSTLLLNNDGLKTILETNRERLKNIQKQNILFKNKYNNIKQLNESLKINISAKKEFIIKLKQENEKLNNLNQELYQINSDLTHELDIYDQTILNKKNIISNNNNNKNNKNRKEIDYKKDNNNNNNDQIFDNMPDLILSPPINHNNKIFRRSSVPTSVYEQNLDFICQSISNDEYKFIEDLNREKLSSLPVNPRSDILVLCHMEAEKEFFLLMVLCCKLEISTKNKIINPKVSDINSQILWNKAQDQLISIHQFHKFIHDNLIKILNNNKNQNKQIHHHWKSYNSIIYKNKNKNKNNNNNNNNNNKKNNKKNKNQNKNRLRSYTTNTLPTYSTKQSLIDEDEDDILKAMSQNNYNTKFQRRDSQNIKKTIIKSYNDNKQQIVADTYDLL